MDFDFLFRAVAGVLVACNQVSTLVVLAGLGYVLLHSGCAAAVVAYDRATLVIRRAFTFVANLCRLLWDLRLSARPLDENKVVLQLAQLSDRIASLEESVRRQSDIVSQAIEWAKDQALDGGESPDPVPSDTPMPSEQPSLEASIDLKPSISEQKPDEAASNSTLNMSVGSSNNLLLDFSSDSSRPELAASQKMPM